MSSKITLQELEESTRSQADQADGDFVTQKELRRFLNQGIAELHLILVNTYEEYFREIATITTVNGTSDYDLPSNFMKVLKVRLSDGDNSYNVKQFMTEEYEDNIYADIVNRGAIVPFRYRVMGDKLVLHPVPTEAKSIALWYVPDAVKLTQPHHTVHYSVAPGWDEFVVSHASAMCALKENDDSFNKHMARKQAYAAMIKESATPRNAGDPQRIVDVRNGRNDNKRIRGN